jgi:hypothetical protein
MPHLFSDFSKEVKTHTETNTKTDIVKNRYDERRMFTGTKKPLESPCETQPTLVNRQLSPRPYHDFLVEWEVGMG